MVLELAETHPLWDSASGQQLEGCQSHKGSGESDWKWNKSWANSIVSSLTPIYSTTKRLNGLPHPGKYLRLCPSQHNRYTRESKKLCLIDRNKHREAAKLGRQRNMTLMKEQNKPQKKNKMKRR